MANIIVSKEDMFKLRKIIPKSQKFVIGHEKVKKDFDSMEDVLNSGNFNNKQFKEVERTLETFVKQNQKVYSSSLNVHRRGNVNEKLKQFIIDVNESRVRDIDYLKYKNTRKFLKSTSVLENAIGVMLTYVLRIITYYIYKGYNGGTEAKTGLKQSLDTITEGLKLSVIYILLLLILNYILVGSKGIKKVIGYMRFALDRSKFEYKFDSIKAAAASLFKILFWPFLKIVSVLFSELAYTQEDEGSTITRILYTTNTIGVRGAMAFMYGSLAYLWITIAQMAKERFKDYLFINDK